MNFAEAWALLLEGKRIRRASWDRGFYWYCEGGDVWEHSPDEPMRPTWIGLVIGSVPISQATATDWEQQ